MTQKLEEKILYDARGDVHSRLMCKVYEPMLLEKTASEYSPIPIIKAGPRYDPIPILKSGNYDRYALARNKEDKGKTEKYSLDKAA